MTPLGRALRQRFPKGPRQALAALGLPPSLLDIKRLALDGALENRGTSAKVKLEEILCALLSGSELQAARDLLHGIDATEANNGEEEAEENGEQPEREESPGRARMRAFIKDRSSATDEDVDELFARLDTLPRNAMAGGMGGRLSAAEREEAQDRKMARDERLRARSATRWPEAQRIVGDSVPTPMPAPRSIAASLERWPEARRIGVA